MTQCSVNGVTGLFALILKDLVSSENLSVLKFSPSFSVTRNRAAACPEA